MRVQAVAAGFYKGQMRAIGDVFDLLSPSDLSDSTVSQVPIGNPDYPLYGWMLQVPATATLVNQSLNGMGQSATINGYPRVVY